MRDRRDRPHRPGAGRSASGLTACRLVLWSSPGVILGRAVCEVGGVLKSFLLFWGGGLRLLGGGGVEVGGGAGEGAGGAAGAGGGKTSIQKMFFGTIGCA